MPEQVLVCDDDVRRVQTWVTDLKTHFPSTEACTGQDLATLVAAINERSENARTTAPADGEPAQPPVTSEPPVLGRLDASDYVFLDFDLTPDQSSRSAADGDDNRYIDQLRGRTGERLAYLSRAHSTAGYLVVVNQHFKTSTFDLTMQRFSTSFADLNISADDLTNGALWSGTTDSTDSFHPWSWPTLYRAHATTVACRELVADIDKPVLETLDLPRRAFHSRQLDVFPGDPDEATFESLLASGLGLDPKDEPTDTSRSIVAASVLSRWLIQVLAAQNVISDLPHVLARFPNLGNDELFRSTALKVLPPDDLPPILRDSRHERISELVGRDVWTVDTARRLSANQTAVEGTALAFCEDTSTFTELESALEVDTDLPGPYARRFVKRLEEGISYQPSNRLLG